MQKVITVTGRSIFGYEVNNDVNQKEILFPELNELLEDGYKIIETIPMFSNVETYFTFVITFVLEK